MKRKSCVVCDLHGTKFSEKGFPSTEEIRILMNMCLLEGFR